MLAMFGVDEAFMDATNVPVRRALSGKSDHPDANYFSAFAKVRGWVGGWVGGWLGGWVGQWVGR
jgi:hypothetical protein